MHRAVVDTNVFVSALLGSAVTRSLKTALEQGRFTLVTSDRLLRELIAVLSRPELSLKADTVAELTALILERAEVAPPTSKVTDCRDPKDNMVLEAALDGHATHLVTGDEDLLVLNPFRGVAVVRPAQFLEIIRHG